MAGHVLNGIMVTKQGENLFHDVKDPATLLGTFAGFASMSWEFPEKAGVFKSEQVGILCNTVAERLGELLHEFLEYNLSDAIPEGGAADLVRAFFNRFEEQMIRNFFNG